MSDILMRAWLPLLAALLALACNSSTREPTELTVEFIAPTEGTVVVDEIDVVVKVAPSSDSVTVELGGIAVLRSRSGDEFTFTWQPTSGAGDVTVAAHAMDSNTGEVATAALRLAHEPRYRPRWRVCDPECHGADASMVWVGEVKVSVELPHQLREDAAVVTLRLDGAEIATATSYPFELALDTTALPDGRHGYELEFAPVIGEGEVRTGELRVANCDRDGDGFAGPACGGDDCDDTDDAVFPGAVELCDGVLQDCDGAVDAGAECARVGEVCLDGSCQQGHCVVQDQPCTRESQGRWPFVCDIDAGACRQRCALDHVDPIRACPEGRSCRASAAVDSDAEGWCVTPECTGVTVGACPEPEVCVPYDFGFGECVPASDRGVGEFCTLPQRTDRPLEDPCDAESECFAGHCVETCDPNVTSCDGGRACVRIWDSDREVPAGTCLSPCRAFSRDGCAGGSSCQPLADYAFTQTIGWACVPAEAEIVGEGELCERGVDVCEGGTRCFDASGSSGLNARCTRACDLTAEGDTCGEGFVCAREPGGGGYACVQECALFPRQGTGGYGCAEPDATCLPLTFPRSVCVVDDAVLADGETCEVDRRFGLCADGGYCVALEFGGDPRCHKLCRLNASATDCPDGSVCNPRPLFDGVGGIGVCDPEPLARDVGDVCEALGRSCAAPGTICLDLGDGPKCRKACGSPDDCPGSRCEFVIAPDGLVLRGVSGVCAL